MDLLKTCAVVVFFSVFCALHISSASTEVGLCGLRYGRIRLCGS